MHRRTLAALVILGLIGAACGSDPEAADTSAPPGETGPDPATFAAQVASYDLWIGDTQDVQIGVFSSTEEAGIQLVTGGTIQVTFSPFGGGDPGAPLGARYLPAPGTAGDATSTLSLTNPDAARGVYQADDVTFDEAGIWQADVAFEIEGAPIALATQFEVVEEPRLPAPGQPALASDSLTMDDATADPAAVDSRAATDGQVPDPDLHQVSIEDAVGSGSPTLVLFATPVYCQSQFCGPDVEWLEDLAAERPKDATYLHIEIWQDYQAQTVNEAAAEWLYRDDELTEPWLFLIDAEGTIAERWGPLFDPADVEAALDRASM